MPTELEKARAAIIQRHGSVHAFCRLFPDLNRTTVYAVLRGRYAGNAGRQLARIIEALELSATEKESDHIPTTRQLEEILREAACSRCPLIKSQPSGICVRCAPTHLVQAQAVRSYLESHGASNER